MAADQHTLKYTLSEDQIPDGGTTWPPIWPAPPPPPLHPGTLQPIGPEALAPLFPMALIAQEVSQERAIRSRIRCATSTGCGGRRLYRAPLERHLDTPARIYYKYEGREPGRQPQAEYRGRPGVLQQRGRHHPHRDRDRRRVNGWRSPAACSASRSTSTW